MGGVPNPASSRRLETITGVVLAGGHSTRMGTDKALLRLRRRTLTKHCLDALRQCFTHNIVLSNHPERLARLRVPVFPDDVPHLGPLGGIATALRRAPTPAVFIVACDMPFLNPNLIRDMAAALGRCDAVVARPGGRFEPLHAVYHRRALPVIEAHLARGDYSVQRCLRSLRVKMVTKADVARYPNWRRIFLNINTPRDFQRAQQLLKKGTHHGKQDR